MLYGRLALSSVVFLLCGVGLVSAQETQIADLADKLASQISASGRKVVAVVSFTSEKDPASFGRFLVNRLSIQLASRGKDFQIVTRTRVDEVSKEVQKRYAEGFNSKAFVEMGQMLGAQAIITGDYLKQGSHINVGAQVIDVKTGLIVGGSEVNIPLTDDVKDLLGEPTGAPAPLPQPQVQEPPRGSQVPTRPVFQPNAGRGAPPTAGGSNLEAEVDGVSFQMQGCRGVGSNVICNFIALSKDNDAHINLHGPLSVAFDMEGREYKANLVELGNRSGAALNDQFLVADVPTRGQVVFPEVNRRAREFSLVKLYVLTKRGMRNTFAEFRQVPLN